ncbi:MAG: hypothetical protein OEW60_07865 [Thiovulaceae bacterium]|nr:hypothetical protein [Sulfurimonadaceae bacterium]
MRHYTLSRLILVTFILLFATLTFSFAQEYKLYDDCEEYYDSRGFYHNECQENEFKAKKALKSFKDLHKFLEPGDGPKKLKDESTTQQADALLAQPKDKAKEKKNPLDALFEDTKSDDKEEEELSQPETEVKSIKSNNKALKERPKLEFGRE